MRHSFTALMVALGMTIVFTIHASAQIATKESPPAKTDAKQKEELQTARGDLADPKDLEAFFDGAVPLQLQTKHIAGAVVVIVKGDRVIFKKGYGLRDVDKRLPVDPDQTQFRVGSISKLFTWTAVMQLVEAKKIDLNTDINQYLKGVQIPATYAEPITLKHLLTHTPGFEDNIIGLFSHNVEGVRPLADVLVDQMPGRVRPPGLLPAYSNHGTALAGLAVASVANQKWEEYIEQHIFQPLKMKNSLVRQPSEEDLPAELSAGYKWSGEKFDEKGFEYLPAAPAGCISLSGADAGRFMLAYLNDGSLEGGEILKPATVQLMRQSLYRADPKCLAMCYGFWEGNRYGQRTLGHGGDTLWFHSTLEMIPDEKVGFFVSYNTDTGAGEGNRLFSAFMKRYYPQPLPAKIEASEGFQERARELVGEYDVIRRPYTSVVKLAALTGGVQVSVNSDDTLSINSSRFVELEPLVYRELYGNRKIVFQKDAGGKVRYLFFADAPPISAVRLEWYEKSMVQLGLLLGCGLVFLSTVLFWPPIAFCNRGQTGSNLRRSWFSAILSCLGWLLAAAAIAVGVICGIGLSDEDKIVFGDTGLIKVLLATTPVVVGLALSNLVGCILAWRNGYWRLSARFHYTLLAIAGLAFSWFLYQWNLLPGKLLG